MSTLTQEDIDRLREKLTGIDRYMTVGRNGVYHLSDLTLALHGVLILSTLMLHVLDTIDAADRTSAAGD